MHKRNSGLIFFRSSEEYSRKGKKKNKAKTKPKTKNNLDG